MASDTNGNGTGAETYQADGGIAAAFPPFDTTTFTSQLFWLAIAFVILYVLLSKAILPKLGGIIEERKNRIASDLDEAATLKAGADEALAETEKQLAVARANARSKADQTRLAIDKKISAASEVTAKELNQKLADAEVRIQEMKTAAMANVSDIAVETTEAILTRLNCPASEADIRSSVARNIPETVA
jgi:F-type H+-transporting ATPase subunit b